MADDWRNVTASSPCPKCGKGDWCSVSNDGNACACRRLADGGTEKVDESGATFYFHRLNGSAFSNGNSNGFHIEPSYSLADGSGRIADPDILHQVYSAFIAFLSLNATHEENLCARELRSAEQSTRQIVKRLGYVTHGQRRLGAVNAVLKAGL